MCTESDIKSKGHRAFDLAARQLRHFAEQHRDLFPMYTVDGKWKHVGEAWTNWCEGFLGGQLWLLYGHIGDDWWREKAEHYSRLIEHRMTDQDVHDLGFLFSSTWKRWYGITGDPAINDVVIEAGRTMALLFFKLMPRQEAEQFPTVTDLLERGLIVGTPPEVVDQLGRLAEVDVQRVMLQWLELDDLDRLEALARAILG